MCKNSSILEDVHKTATGLRKAGVMDKVTPYEFDRLCPLVIEQLEPERTHRHSAHIAAPRRKARP